MRKILLFICLGLTGLYAMPLRAQEVLPKADFSELRQDTTAIKAQKVIDPLTFISTSGTIYRLAGLDVPGLDTGVGSDIVEQATKKVGELLNNQDIKAYVTKDQTTGRMNRMGQSLIQAERKKDSLWIQGQLIADGLARVRTTGANPQMVKALLALEESARSQKKGLWADAAYAVLTPETVKPGINSFVLVEGRVFSVATRNNETFLNFGADWKKDFTIGISPDMRRAISKKGLNYAALTHKTVRVRGFIEDRNGPFITLDHPEQLEVVGGTMPTIETPQTPGMKSMKVPEKPKVPEIKKPESPSPPRGEGRDEGQASETPSSNLLPEVEKALRGLNE